jgi:hypothetical protein
MLLIKFIYNKINTFFVIKPENVVSQFKSFLQAEEHGLVVLFPKSLLQNLQQNLLQSHQYSQSPK